MYKVVLSKEAQEDLLLLQKHAPASLKKVRALFKELEEHPRIGTGQVEQMKHCTVETWSRRINREHRLVYRIYDDVVEVLVLSMYGHYC